MTDSDTRHATPPGFCLRHEFQWHRGQVNRIAWSPDGQMLASGGQDNTVRIWNAETGVLHRAIEGHTDQIYGVAWSPDGRLLASTSQDRTVRLWDARTGELVRNLRLADAALSVSWSPDGQMLASGSIDNAVRLWETAALLDASAETTGPYKTLEGHSGMVVSVMWSPGGQTLVSLSRDTSIRLWEATTGALRRVLKGHHHAVWCATWSPNGEELVSCSTDRTIRFWNPETGQQTNALEGFTGRVSSISFSADGRLLAAKSEACTIHLWRCDTWQALAVLDEPSASLNWYTNVSFHPLRPILCTVSSEENSVIRIWDVDFDALVETASVIPTTHFINAKVVLVGESGVGKSSLGIHIAEKEFRSTEPTHGAQFWQIPVGQVNGLPHNTRIELTLWDLAGQPQYHLVHQLFLNDIDMALLLFDCSNPTDPFRGVPYWAKVLRKHAPQHAVKLLVAARCDINPVMVDESEVRRVLDQYGLDGYLCTSAKTGEGVNELVQRVLECLPWHTLPRTTTPRLFQIVREFLLERKQGGSPLVEMSEIRRRVQRRHMEREATKAELDTAVELLQARGLVYRLDPTPRISWVLLQPERINQYASSVVQAARSHPRGIGAVSERDVVTANLPFSGFERLEPGEEKIVLESMVELLIQHGLCFREMGQLVFPSQLNLARPTSSDYRPRPEIIYQFSGSVEAIYASLVVHLSYTDYFQRENCWKYAAEFSRNEHRMGFTMRQLEEGTGELEIYFRDDGDEFDRVVFARFITDHLRAKGIDVEERIPVYCPKCGNEIKSRDAVQARLRAGEVDIPCQYCATMVIIPRSIEELYHSEHLHIEKHRELGEVVEKRRQREVIEFKADRQQYTRGKDRRLQILHLSDIHLGTSTEARKYRVQLETDLKLELGIDRLDYLVVSGDVANYSTPEEYEAAFELLDGLVKRFGLDADRLVVVPGNHDLNWDLSEEAYRFVSRRKVPSELPEGQYIPIGDAGALLCDEERYRQRFAHFNAHFYKRVYGQEYPLDYSEQAVLHLYPDDQLVFLALNSAWRIDHHFRNRAEINMEALARTLDRLQNGTCQGWLKIAVWHHPITGPEMMNDEFLQLLVIHGFQICLHGHIHEAIEAHHRYDARRTLHIVGAGTFGAPLRGQAGIPLQYNLLSFDWKTRSITVETRRREKPNGAWFADARWGNKSDPKPSYVIQLRH